MARSHDCHVTQQQDHVTNLLGLFGMFVDRRAQHSNCSISQLRRAHLEQNGAKEGKGEGMGGVKKDMRGVCVFLNS